MKGSIYDDFASVRVIDIAKVRASKTILSKAKFEFAIVCPGEVTENPNDEDKIYAKETKRALAVNVFTNQIKGKTFRT